MKHKGKSCLTEGENKANTQAEKEKEKAETEEGGTMDRSEEMMVQVNFMKEKESALDKQFSCLT